MTDLFQAADERAMGIYLRDRGIAKVSNYPHDGWVQKAKDIAVMLAAKNGTVTSDELQNIFPRPQDVPPNAVGAVFRDKRLVYIGSDQSERATAHARRIGVYMLRN